VFIQALAEANAKLLFKGIPKAT